MVLHEVSPGDGIISFRLCLASHDGHLGRGGRGEGVVQGGDSPPLSGVLWCRFRERDTSKSTGCSGRQKAATRHNMRREERVTV